MSDFLNLDMSDKFLYFAFGSNLLESRVKINSPSAEFICYATLKNYKLVFAGWSERWQGASGTVQTKMSRLMIDMKNSHCWTWSKQRLSKAKKTMLLVVSTQLIRKISLNSIVRKECIRIFTSPWRFLFWGVTERIITAGRITKKTLLKGERNRINQARLKNSKRICDPSNFLGLRECYHFRSKRAQLPWVLHFPIRVNRTQRNIRHSNVEKYWRREERRWWAWSMITILFLYKFFCTNFYSLDSNASLK